MTEDARQSVLDNADVRYTHLRDIDGYPFDRETTYDLKKAGLRPSAKGGMTVAILTFPDGRQIVGVAECSPRDNFYRKTGRDIALGRALKAALA